MNSQFILRVRCASAGTAKKLAVVLAPDNKGVPVDQRFSMKVRSDLVTVRVESYRPGSGFNTIRSGLRDVALFREIWLISREAGA